MQCSVLSAIRLESTRLKLSPDDLLGCWLVYFAGLNGQEFQKALRCKKAAHVARFCDFEVMKTMLLSDNVFRIQLKEFYFRVKQIKC